MSKTATKPLPLGKPRATKYLEIIEQRDGKRKRAQVEKAAREIAAQQDPPARVVRFEFVAEAAGVTLDQMAAELAEHGIRTSPSNVKHGALNGKTKTTDRKATVGKDGPGNARKATPSKAKGSPTTKASSSSKKRGAEVTPDPKHKPTTGSGSAKRSESSRKRAGSRGRAASSSPSKSQQTRKLREQQVSTRS